MTSTRPTRPRLALLIVLHAVSAATLIATPIPIRDVIDGLGRDEAFEFYLGPILVIVALGIGGTVLQFVADRVGFAIGFAAIRTAQDAVYERLLRMPILFFTTSKPGALASRVTNDVAGMEALYSDVVPKVVTSLTSLVIAAGVLIVINPILLVILAIVPLCLIPIRIAERKINEDIQETFAITRDLSSNVGSVLTGEGITLARQSGRTRDELARFGRLSEALARVSLRTAGWRVSTTLVYGIVFTIVTAGIVLLCAWLATTGTASTGDVVLALIYSLQIRQPVSAIINTRYPLLRASISRDRVEAVLNWNDPRPAQPEIPEPADTSQGPRPALEVRGLTYRYPDPESYSIDGLSHVGDAMSIGWLPLALLETDKDGTPHPRVGAVALDSIDLSVERGTMVAVVGPSGGGKSTFAALCVGLLQPDSGAVLIDGKSIVSYSEEELAHLVAYISQETHVLHASVRENLLYAAPAADDDEIRAACEAARFTTVVDGLPDGFDTVVGERGHRLSGGERQRLAIARAILRRPTLIVLDEPTAHLDAQTEAEVKVALRDALSGYAVLMIAHRLSTISDADSIVVLEKGRITEAGRHGELLALGGSYARLVAAQSSE